MEKNKDESIEILMQKISQLPPEGQSAMSFVIKNFHFIKKCAKYGNDGRGNSKPIGKSQGKRRLFPVGFAYGGSGI